MKNSFKNLLIISTLPLALLASPEPALATSLAEELTKFRASFARATFSHYKAMPLHLRFDVKVGEVISILNEDRVRKDCYSNLEIEIDDAQETHAVSVSSNTSLSLGLGGKAKFYGIPVGAEAEFERQAKSSAQTVLLRTGYTYPKDGVESVADRSNVLSQCQKLLPPALTRDGPVIFVSGVYEGRLVTQHMLDTNFAASIEANARITPRSLPITVEGNTNGAAGKSLVTAHLRPKGSMAVRPAFINLNALAEYYTLANSYPETWAELERVVDSYITSEEPVELWPVIERIRLLWERLEERSLEELDVYRERLFAPGSTDLFANESLVEATERALNELGQEAWETIGTIAAAAEIVSQRER